MQEAAAGGGRSYAALYDRYAEKVYNYCLRLTGSPDDAADATQDAFVNVLRRLQDDDRPVLDFASYLFAAARNESYALMRRRSRTHPTEEPPERAASMPDLETDPERAVLLRDSQEQVRQANAQLAPRHREVLALREVAERSYDEIGEIMGISENAAAQLLWRARAKLKEALTAGAVASVVAASEDCETAQLLISRLQDGEPITDEEHIWLDEHLDECGSCRAARGMLFEVGASYRAWAPVAVVATLRPEVLTQAGHVVGADWSGIAGKAGVSQGTIAGAATGVAVLAAVGIAISGLFKDDAKVAREAATADQAPAESKPEPSAAAAKAKAKPRKVHPLAKVTAVKSGKPAAPALLAAAPIQSPEPQNAPPADKPTPKPVKPAPKVEKPAAPQPPAKPAPVIPPPAQTAPGPPPPPAARGGECTFPGRHGPGGCPPGHGGIPPGHGGTAPGQFGRS